MKQENVERRKEEVRQHVLQQTGEMFTAFEASVRDGLLEQLENDSADAQEIPGTASLDEERIPGKDMDGEVTQDSAQEPPDSDVDENEDWDSQPEELETILREAEQEVNFGDSEKMEELEEIEEPRGADDTGKQESDGDDTGESETGFDGDDTGKPETGLDGGDTGEPGIEFDFEDLEFYGEDMEEPGTDETGDTEEEAVHEALAQGAEEPENPESEAAADKESEAQEIPADKKGKSAGQKQETDGKQSNAAREKGKVRSLTREEKELYGPYIQSRASREQLVQAIDNISMAAYTGNIIITGEEGMDTVSLAKNMIREVQLTDSNFAGKVAKISGQALNKKDVESTIHQLASGALIIQKASGMDADTAKRLHKALQQESFGIIVILEDVKKSMNKFLEQHSELAACFTARMDVESLSNGTLVAFGRKYAREREYSIDDMGILALHTRIDEMQTSDHVVTVMEVKELVDNAIKHANRKTIKHFFDILFAKRYDEEDMIILSENDFV